MSAQEGPAAKATAPPGGTSGAEPAPAAAAIDWMPYRVVGGLLLASLALNAATRNGLWFWYTIVGLALLLFVAGGVRHFKLRLPPVAVWMAGTVAALHYAGGSLSGIHSIGGPNGLYYVFPWWDNAVHFLGAAAVAIAAHAFLGTRIESGGWALGTLSVCVAVTAGVLVELYEFSQFLLFGTIDQGFYTNTLLDLYYNLLGGAAGAVAYARVSKRAAAGSAQRSRAATTPREPQGVEDRDGFEDASP